MVRALRDVPRRKPTPSAEQVYSYLCVLDRPFATPLDKTSRISLGPFKGRIIFHANEYRDGGAFQTCARLVVRLEPPAGCHLRVLWPCARRVTSGPWRRGGESSRGLASHACA